MSKSRYIIPDDCVCVGDGLYGMHCYAKLHATLREDELEHVLRASLAWIDAIPKDVALPTMPGFDRDWAEATLAGKAYA